MFENKLIRNSTRSKNYPAFTDEFNINLSFLSWDGRGKFQIDKFLIYDLTCHICGYKSVGVLMMVVTCLSIFLPLPPAIYLTHKLLLPLKI